MTPVTSDLLGSFFQRYGWQFTELSPGVFASGWQGERQFYPLSVRLDPLSVTFEVRPFLAYSPHAKKISDHWNQRSSLLRAVDDLNRRLTLVRVSVPSTSELVMVCQLLAAGFSYSSFTRVLEVFGYYADILIDEINPQLLAHGVYLDTCHMPSILS